ncbi:MAG TPA: hypothetical protein VF521_13480 [Pyrinomonadaceae bacterium]|jgi:hypothetical protein
MGWSWKHGLIFGPKDCGVTVIGEDAKKVPFERVIVTNAASRRASAPKVKQH